MPRDFKDTMFFTLFMCSLMVLGMSVWNLYLLEHFFLGNLAAGFLPGFITGFLLDVILIGPLVKGLSFRFLKDYHKRWQKSAVISGGMVLMMVSLMSIYGLFFNGEVLSMEKLFGSLGNKLCNGCSPQLSLGWFALSFYTRGYPETFPR